MLTKFIVLKVVLLVKVIGEKDRPIAFTFYFQCYGKDMEGIYFFTFGSCEALMHCVQGL